MAYFYSKDSRKIRGRINEIKLAQKLGKSGWRLIIHDWLPPRNSGAGQVDLVMESPQKIYWIFEVKTLDRPDNGEIPILHPDQLFRLKKSVLHWESKLGRSVNFAIALFYESQGRVEFLKNPW
jgi:hypothetical protein